jgi:hypothetical protein
MSCSDPIKISAFVSRIQAGALAVVSFNVNSSYEMPINLLTSDISQFQSVLTCAAKLIDLEKSISNEYVKDTLFSEYAKTLEDKHRSECFALEQRAITEVTSKISPLLETIQSKEISFSDQIKQVRSEYESQIKQIQREKKKLEDDATATKCDLEASLKRDTKGLQKQIAELEKQLQSASTGEQIIREQCKTESERIIKMIEDKHEKAMVILKDSYEQATKLRDEMLQQKERALVKREQDQLTALQRNASSSFRGTDGETFFQDLVQDKMKWKLTNTSKIPHSCDYSSNIHDSSIFFEVKNYTSEVRQEEVSKFLRDMKEHPEVTIGIFISLNTRIVGKNSEIPIFIEWIHENQCAIYIHSFKDMDMDATLSVVDQLIKVIALYTNRLRLSGEVSEESKFQPMIDKAKIYIEQYINESSILMKRIVNDKKRHLEIVESTYSNTIASLKTQNTAISTVFEILCGSYKEDMTIDELLIQDPVVSLKKSKKSTTKY